VQLRLRPNEVTRTAEPCSAGWPRISASGALSVPTRQSAISMSMARKATFLFLDNDHARPCTRRTWDRPMGQLLFVAGGHRRRPRGEKVLRRRSACGAWSGAFSIRHGNKSFRFWARFKPSPSSRQFQPTGLDCLAARALAPSNYPDVYQMFAGAISLDSSGHEASQRLQRGRSTLIAVAGLALLFTAARAKSFAVPACTAS